VKLYFANGSISHYVLFTSFRTNCLAIFVEVEAESGFGDPAYLDGRVADHQGIGFDGFGYHGAGAHKGKFADVVAADDGGVGADGSPAFHGSSGVFLLPVDVAAGVDDIGKDAGGSEEDIVFASDPGVDGDVVLNLYVVAQYHFGRDDHILADVTVLPDHCARHDVGEVPYFGAGSDGAAGVDAGGVMGKVVGHRSCLV
jgi:hypothetical protein